LSKRSDHLVHEVVREEPNQLRTMHNTELNSKNPPPSAAIGVQRSDGAEKKTADAPVHLSTRKYKSLLAQAPGHLRCSMIVEYFLQGLSADITINLIRTWWEDVRREDDALRLMLPSLLSAEPQANMLLMNAQDLAEYHRLPDTFRVHALPGRCEVYPDGVHLYPGPLPDATERKSLPESLGVLVDKRHCAVKRGTDLRRLIVCFRPEQMSRVVTSLTSDGGQSAKLDHRLSAMLPSERTRALVERFYEGEVPVDRWVRIVYRWWTHIDDVDGELSTIVRTLHAAEEREILEVRPDVSTMLWHLAAEPYASIVRAGKTEARPEPREKRRAH
jgi:hypothetical protein